MEDTGVEPEETPEEEKEEECAPAVNGFIAETGRLT